MSGKKTPSTPAAYQTSLVHDLFGTAPDETTDDPFSLLASRASPDRLPAGSSRSVPPSGLMGLPNDDTEDDPFNGIGDDDLQLAFSPGLRGGGGAAPAVVGATADPGASYGTIEPRSLTGNGGDDLFGGIDHHAGEAGATVSRSGTEGHVMGEGRHAVQGAEKPQTDAGDEDPFHGIGDDGLVDGSTSHGNGSVRASSFSTHPVSLGLQTEDDDDPFNGVGEDGDEIAAITSEVHGKTSNVGVIGETLDYEQDQPLGAPPRSALSQSAGSNYSNHTGDIGGYSGLSSHAHEGDIGSLSHADSSAPAQEKDYSALLDEFDDILSPMDGSEPFDHAHEPVVSIPNADERHVDPSPSAPSPPAELLAPRTAEDLFSSDDAGFDDILGGSVGDEVATPVVHLTPPDLESPVPVLSIEQTPERHAGDVSVQSMFSSASDWLDDTTIDESFQVSHQPGNETPEPHPAALPPTVDTSADSISDEVPLGWEDENGDFHYYTEDERRAVEAQYFRPAPQLAHAATASSSALSGGSFNAGGGSDSENAARRTPQPVPAQTEPYAPPPPSDPYALPSQPQSSPGYGSASSANDLYTPSSASTGFSSSTTSGYTSSSTNTYDPYAPVPQPFAATSYTPAVASSSLVGPPAVPTKKEPPAKAQRVVSNAYDPPFLRPQKSFVRPASAQSPAFTPPPIPMPPAPTQPAPAAASAPPPGPPRRMPSYQAPPASSSPMHSAAPPLPPLEAQGKPAPPPAGPPRGPPSRPTSQASQRQAAPQYSSFDPPLRPASAARSASRQAFTPPLPSQAAMPPKTEPIPSRPPPGRQASPFAPSPAVRPRTNLNEHLGVGQSAAAGQAPLDGNSVRFQNQDGKSASGVPTDRGWPHLGGDPEEDEREAVEERPEPVEARFGRGLGGLEEDQDEWTRPSQESPAQNQNYLASPQDIVPPVSFTRQPPPVGQTSFSPPSPPKAAKASAPPTAGAYDPYAPQTRRPSSPPAFQRPVQAAADPYAPSGHTVPALETGIGALQRSRPPIPAGFMPPPPIPAISQQQSNPYGLASQAYTPYAGEVISSYTPTSAPRTQSQSEYAPLAFNSTFAPPSDPYGINRATSPPSESVHSDYNGNYFQGMHLDTSYVPQQVLEQRPVSEDPLQRCTFAAKNVPLAVFGFGGTIITAFPALAEDARGAGHNRTQSYGYASGRGKLFLRQIAEVMQTPETTTVFPGPLILDLSSPRGAAGDKKKKESILAYLEARAEEIEKGLPYLKSNVSGLAGKRQEEEGRLILLRLLRAMIIGEGKFSGNAKVDDALRLALANPSASQPLLSPSAAASFTGLNQAAPIGKSSSATSAQLSTLSDLLCAGDRRGAIEYAASGSLWSHALIIASSVDPEVWRDVVSRFIKAEVTAGGGLKASYTLFAGSSPTTVDELYAASGLDMDPSSDRWREVIASVVFNGRPADLSCFDELGARFMQHGLANAAYACFLLSPVSPFIDPTTAAFDRPLSIVNNARDEDAAVFAEVAEYARNLIPVPKGQEVPFPGLPALLPIKLQRAWRAAEQGEVDLAQRYCNAVEAASKMTKSGPALLSPFHLASLEDLLERLTGTPSIEPAKGLSARKQAAKPGLDKLGSWIEGRLTKFIAGEDDPTAPAAKPVPIAKSSTGAPIGPFSHFSTISPSPSQSNAVSRNPSVPDLNGGSGTFGFSGLTAPGMDSRRTSSGFPSPGAEVPPRLSMDSARSHDGGYAPYASSDATRNEPSFGDESRDGEDTPQAYGDGELLSPMASLSLSAPPYGASSSAQRGSVGQSHADDADEDEDDLGFGNAALSRNRTPKPPASSEDSNEKKPDVSSKDTKKPVELAKAVEESPSKADAAKSGGWFKGWWGKKDGSESPSSGPVRAKLGDDNAMVYDKDLKRWIVKGQKPEALPAAPPPPPRSQTVSPSKAARGPPDASRAMSSTPPPSQFATLPRSGSAPTGLTDQPDFRPPRRSGLAESVTADQAPPAAATLSATAGPPSRPPTAGPPTAGPGTGSARPPSAGPPGPPGTIGLGQPPPRPAKSGATASIDDLLSRPPSKRPASAAAKKGARNRYVDVFQPTPGGAGET